MHQRATSSTFRTSDAPTGAGAALESRVEPGNEGAVDAVSEWVAACDGLGIRISPLRAFPGPAVQVIADIASRANEAGLLVYRLDAREATRTPVQRLRGRSVLVLASSDPRQLDAEALAWVRLGRLPVKLAAIVDGAGAGAGLSPGRNVSRASLRAAPTRPRALERRRAHAIEAAAWRLARRGALAKACRLFRRAVEAWCLVADARPATRALVAYGAALLARGDVADAATVACCGVRAATSLGRHRWSAARHAGQVQAAWADAVATAWPRHRSFISRPQGSESESRSFVRRPGGPSVMDDLIQVLQACHDAEDAPAMSRMCSVVRDRLGASAVGVVAAGQPAALAGAGHVPFASPEIAARVLGSAELVEPSAGLVGVEAAAPVRLGGAPIGALCCRWPVGATPDAPRARALLVAAATACAPGLRAIIESQRRAEPGGESYGIIGASPSVSALRLAIRRAAAVPFAVLIEGESGSGKELVARAIHEASARRKRRFCAVNCAAISDELFEAELFGHAKGAFTGAMGERAGLFEEADGGTLMLDEVGELTPRGQAKLLRVLQEGEVRRVGENVPRRVDVRVVAATNRSLALEARAHRFRDDLRFRLDVIRIPVPPLRERREDIPLLLDHYWHLALARTGGRARLDEDTVDLLVRYQWPGNVRELQNLTATLAVRAPARGRVRPSDLPFHVTTSPAATTLQSARRQFDAGLVRATLTRCGGRRAEAARQLGMTRQGLAKLMSRLDVETGEPVGKED